MPHCTVIPLPVKYKGSVMFIKTFKRHEQNYFASLHFPTLHAMYKLTASKSHPYSHDQIMPLETLRHYFAI